MGLRQSGHYDRFVSGGDGLVKDVIIALAGTVTLALLFDITSRGRKDEVSRVLNFLATPIAALIVFASFYFHGGGR